MQRVWQQTAMPERKTGSSLDSGYDTNRGIRYGTADPFKNAKGV